MDYIITEQIYNLKQSEDFNKVSWDIVEKILKFKPK